MCQTTNYNLQVWKILNTWGLLPRTDRPGENWRQESEKVPKRHRRMTETRMALSQVSHPIYLPLYLFLPNTNFTPMSKRLHEDAYSFVLNFIAKLTTPELGWISLILLCNSKYMGWVLVFLQLSWTGCITTILNLSDTSLLSLIPTQIVSEPAILTPLAFNKTPDLWEAVYPPPFFFEEIT